MCESRINALPYPFGSNVPVRILPIASSKFDEMDRRLRRPCGTCTLCVARLVTPAGVPATRARGRPRRSAPIGRMCIVFDEFPNCQLNFDTAQKCGK